MAKKRLHSHQISNYGITHSVIIHFQAQRQNPKKFGLGEEVVGVFKYLVRVKSLLDRFQALKKSRDQEINNILSTSVKFSPR